MGSNHVKKMSYWIKIVMKSSDPSFCEERPEMQQSPRKWALSTQEGQQLCSHSQKAQAVASNHQSQERGEEGHFLRTATVSMFPLKS